MACVATNTISRNYIGNTGIGLRHRTSWSGQEGVHGGPHSEIFKSGFWTDCDNWAGELTYYAELHAGSKVDWIGEVGICDADLISSMHYQARAFDLTRVTLLNGNYTDTNVGWRETSSQAQRRRYLAIAACARRNFGTVLTAWYNSEHHDHIHIDNELASVPTIRNNVVSDTSLVKAACKYLNGADITINGSWNQSAYNKLLKAFGMQYYDPLNNLSHALIFLALITKAGFKNVNASAVAL